MTLPPFQRLLDDHAADVHRYLAAALGLHDGDDCFQETVIAALRAYPQLQDATNLRGWLLTIAHHKVIDHARASSRRPAPVGDVPDAGIHDALPDRDLWAAVRRLPPKQRSAVAHRYLLQLPYAEIAVIVGCSEPAARQNVRAGLAALREDIA